MSRYPQQIPGSETTSKRKVRADATGRMGHTRNRSVIQQLMRRKCNSSVPLHVIPHTHTCMCDQMASVALMSSSFVGGGLGGGCSTPDIAASASNVAAARPLGRPSKYPFF